MNLRLNSERLLLRPLVATDLDLMIALYTDPEISKFIDGPHSKEHIAVQMSNYTKRGGGGCIGAWCVIEQATGEKVGTAELLPLPIDRDETDFSLIEGPELPDAEIEIGYALKKSAWGKGYATEAARRLLAFAFEETQLSEVVGVIDPRNGASRSVLTKSGLIEPVRDRRSRT